jgi:Zn finger protein HypA/HybF involved in hydrogenase expression
MAWQRRGKSRTIGLAIAAAAVVLLTVLLCIFKTRHASGTTVKTPPAVFAVFYTCDTRGHIEPCGCTSGMAGGISRRQTFLAKARPRDFLLVDAGDVTAGPRPWEILELEYILKGYEQMGYHAVNIGHREVSMSFEALQKLKEHCSRFVSANVLGPDGQSVFEPYRVVKFSNGYRCGIIGVADDDVPSESIGDGLSIAPAADAIAKYLPELKKKSDFIMLLAFADKPAMAELARQFFEIDVIVGGKVQQASNELIKENQSVIVYNTDKGKSVGQLDILCAPKEDWQYTNDFTLLAESMKMDARVAAFVEEYKLQLKERDFHPLKDDEEGLSSISASRSKDADKYIGSESCVACHKTSHNIWAETAHAGAFEALEREGNQYNPRCLKCHTIGYMASDGYINQKLTPKLKNVGCESCHGRGDHHVKLKSGQEVPVKQVIMKNTVCTECHDKDNSPNFDEDKYWEMIAHGKE